MRIAARIAGLVVVFAATTTAAYGQYVKPRDQLGREWFRERLHSDPPVVQADDGFGHSVECSATIDVKKRPNVCPTVSLSTDKTSVTVGETVTFTATSSDPDNGPSPVTYEWTSSAGSLRYVSDNEVQIDTTGMSDAVTVSVTATDGDAACRTTKSVEVEIEQPIIEGPGSVKFGDMYFARDGARIDDAMKRVLDDCAVRLRQDSTLRLVVDGHSDAGERAGIALRRAESARRYLVAEKRIDPSMIVVRSFDGRCPRGDAVRNRRVELYPLPQGRAADEIEKGCQ